jgi:hypothetical protein
MLNVNVFTYSLYIVNVSTTHHIRSMPFTYEQRRVAAASSLSRPHYIQVHSRMCIMGGVQRITLENECIIKKKALCPPGMSAQGLPFQLIFLYNL